MLILMMLACGASTVCADLENDFVNQWWQIEVSGIPLDGCYLFSQDNFLVMKGEDNNIPLGKWEVTEIENCQYKIKTEDSIGVEEEITLLGMSEGCWEVEHDSGSYFACQCIQ
jgi:hypothetical protein